MEECRIGFAAAIILAHILLEIITFESLKCYITSHELQKKRYIYLLDRKRDFKKLILVLKKEKNMIELKKAYLKL